MELAECRDNIDERIYKECLELKKLLNSAVKQSLLFGEKFDKTDSLKQCIRHLLSASTEKIKDIEAYIYNNVI